MNLEFSTFGWPYDKDEERPILKIYIFCCCKINHILMVAQKSFIKVGPFRVKGSKVRMMHDGEFPYFLGFDDEYKT